MSKRGLVGQFISLSDTFYQAESDYFLLKPGNYFINFTFP